jgi:hypothetical protein
LSLVLAPDVERLLVDFLLAQPEVVAIVDDRVCTEFPATKVFPLVRLSQFGSLPVAQPRWLQTHTVQVDCYGGPKRTAFLLAETVAAVMDDRLIGTHSEGVVSGVSFTGFADLPDATFEPAKPRRLFVCAVSLHP